jgi:hypothetical protein
MNNQPGLNQNKDGIKLNRKVAAGRLDIETRQKIVEGEDEHPVQTEESKTETKTEQKTGKNKVEQRERETHLNTDRKKRKQCQERW